MTSRNLFTIILKVFALLFIKDFLASMPQLLTTFGYIIQSNGIEEAVAMLLASLLILSIYGLIPYLLLFKSDLVINKLKLDEGFDQPTIPLAVHRSTVLSIAIIIIGGLLVVDEVPTLCRLILTYSQERRDGQVNPHISYVVLSVAKIVIGLLMISNQNQLVNYIKLKRKK